MKRFKIAKILSVVLAAAFAVSVFTTNADAASRGDQYKRELTGGEIQAIATIFDGKFYANAYPDLLLAYGRDYYTADCDQFLFAHFITCGIWEERQCSPKFNVDVYATRNADLHSVFGTDVPSYYYYYATFDKGAANRGTSTLSEAYRRNVDVYSVYDFTVGQVGPNKGAIPVQTQNYAPNLGIKDSSEASMRMRNYILFGAYE